MVWLKLKMLPKKMLRMVLKNPNAEPFPKHGYCKSFFNFFNTLEDDESIKMLEYDYNIGSTIRNKIIPHAVSWFTGEAAQDDNLQDLMGDDDDEDNVEDEEEDDAEEGKLECFTEIYLVCSGNMGDQKRGRNQVYTEREYHYPHLLSWARSLTCGLSGGSQMQQQPGYGNMQTGSCPTQPQYQAAYGEYPSSYPLQSSNQQTQQIAKGIGYNYYGQ